MQIGASSAYSPAFESGIMMTLLLKSSFDPELLDIKLSHMAVVLFRCVRAWKLMLRSVETDSSNCPQPFLSFAGTLKKTLPTPAALPSARVLRAQKHFPKPTVPRYWL